ncbi:YvcK family protein [Bradyrhizobium sp. Pear76]|uniref:2-phospho-L-lactate transferase CofD family protein n=1 Tax=Bradyrhizobium oropedii TaxID=1571201 RepID=UPI001E53AC87|nr:2-phospho-L-lactate transferase CofD family protein [Bradyrhizobium oropedii]MCC8968589.1 YvcK family protein [Bradyrhizobium oropedii]
MKVAVLAGGVGARMVLGFAGIVPPGDLSVTVNVGDDDRFHGLYVCPDLDTVLYTLSGAVDLTQSCGVADDGRKRATRDAASDQTLSLRHACTDYPAFDSPPPVSAGFLRS